MSWINIAWPMMAAACIMLALVHLVVWLKQPAQRAYLLFALAAISVTGVTAGELLMMKAATTGEFAAAQRWHHVPLFAVIVSLVAFVQVFLGTGRLWLAYVVCALRVLVLVANFTTGVSVNYLEISSLRQVAVWGGDVVSVAEAVTNPWTRLGALSVLVLLIYVLDASIGLWRRGGIVSRRRALLVGGSATLAILLAGVHATLVHEGVIRSPYIVTPAFVVILLAMAYELGSDIFRAAQLAGHLRQSEQRMDLAANAADLGLWEWNIVRDEVWATEKGRKLSGFAEADRIDFSHFLERVHPDEREAMRQAVKAALEGGGNYEGEFRVVLPDGAIRWIAAKGRVEFNARGAPVLMRGVSLDVTGRKQAEDALRESEARFRNMADTAPVMIWMSGADKLLTFFNKGWFDFTGRTMEEEAGDGWTAGVHPEDLDRCLAVYARAFDARREFTMEYRLRRRDGEYGWIADIGVPRFAADGAFLGYIGSAFDITERRRMELETVEQRNELAHLSRVAMLGELSGSLAHELNQPLAAILSNAQAAQRFLAAGTGSIDEVREILRDIVEDDRRAGEVIRRLRVLLKKEEAQHHPLDVNEVVHDVLKLMRSDLLYRDVTVDTELAPGLPAVSGDRIQLQQVLLNLMMNGCDAMEGENPSERQLLVRTRSVDGDCVEISVADRGRGIAPENLAHIFEPFVTTKPHGMGLGLSVCRTIVRAHGGSLQAANNPDRGATLSIRLPVNGGGSA